MKRKLIEHAKSVAGLAPKVHSAGFEDGNVIDRIGYLDSLVHVAVGAATGGPTSQSVVLELQTGNEADGSDMQTVYTFDSIDADNVEKEAGVKLDGFKRYVRARVVTDFTGGTSPKIPVAVTLTVGNADWEPAE